MTFEVVLDNLKDFVDVMSVLKNFFETAAFTVTAEGMRLNAIDPSRVVLVDLFLPMTLFSKYKVSKEETLAVNMQRFHKALKLGKSGDTLVLSERNGALVVGLIGNEATYISLNLLAEDVAKADIPELEWKAKAGVMGGSLKRAVTAAAFASDAVLIRATEDELHFIATGDNEEATTRLTMGDVGLLDLESEGEVISAFGVSYLEDIARKLGDDEGITLRIGTDMPLLLTYSIRDEGKVSFMIAPRVRKE